MAFQVVDVAGEPGLEVTRFGDGGEIFASATEAMDKHCSFGTVSHLLDIDLLSSYAR